MTKQIIRVNASSLKESTCMLRWTNTIVQGYYQEVKGASLVYGIAVHKFIDTMFKTGGDMGAARDAALVAFRVPKITGKRSEHLADERHLIYTCIDYWDNYILKDEQFDLIQMPDNRPATEVTFSIPFWENEHHVVHLEGTVDKIGKIRGGCYAVGDYKTTSQYDKDEYLSSYEMSSQLRFYVLSLKLMSQQHPESMLGGIGKTRVGVFIDGIFLKAKCSEIEYKRSKVYIFSDDSLREFENDLRKLCERLSYTLSAGNITREGLLNGSCRGEWDWCQYKNACMAGDSKLSKLVMQREFKQKEYNPLKHND